MGSNAYEPVDVVGCMYQHPVYTFSNACVDCKNKFVDDDLVHCECAAKATGIKTMVVCFKCLALKHPGHKWRTLADMREDVKRQWLADVDRKLRPEVENLHCKLKQVDSDLTMIMNESTALSKQLETAVGTLIDTAKRLNVRADALKVVLQRRLNAAVYDTTTSHSLYEHTLAEVRALVASIEDNTTTHHAWSQASNVSRLIGDADSLVHLLRRLRAQVDEWAANHKA